MTRTLLFGLGLMWTLGVVAQGQLDFEKTIHDFGKIKEVDGAVEYSFKFANIGDQPLKITNVKASCGCTTPFWTKEEVLPGDSGVVTARYNTRNRPGPFNKSLRISSNAKAANLTLFIKGSVEPKPRTIEDDLPSKFGALRVKYRSFNVGKISNEKAFTKSFDVYNDSDSVLTFLTDQFETPEFITLSFEPNSLEPKQKGVMNISYDPTVEGGLGYQSNRVVLKTNEEGENATKALYVIATVVEYFPPMSEEELANAPKLKLSKKVHDFKTISSGSIAETEFVLQNIGKSELNIRETRANCGCTVAALDKDTLAPGEKVKMKVTFHTAGRKGKQFKNVTIFSNDPVASEQMVQIKALIGG